MKQTEHWNDLIQEGYVPLGWIHRKALDELGLDSSCVTDEQLMDIADNLVDGIYDDLSLHLTAAYDAVIKTV